MFSEGQLRAGGEREAPGRAMRWPQAGSLAPGAQVFSGTVSPREEELLEEEYGDLTSREVGHPLSQMLSRLPVEYPITIWPHHNASLARLPHVKGWRPVFLPPRAGRYGQNK